MYEIFEQLLQKYGVTPYQVSKATGISQSTLSNWKNRRNLLSPDKARLIADYFGVTLDYLMTGEENDVFDKYCQEVETYEMAQYISKNKNLRRLFDTAKNATAEELLAVHNMLLLLRRQHEELHRAASHENKTAYRFKERIPAEAFLRNNRLNAAFSKDGISNMSDDDVIAIANALLDAK